MKLVSFIQDGQARYGLIQGEAYVAPSAGFLARFPDLKAVLAANALAEQKVQVLLERDGELAEEPFDADEPE